MKYSGIYIYIYINIRASGYSYYIFWWVKRKYILYNILTHLLTSLSSWRFRGARDRKLPIALKTVPRPPPHPPAEDDCTVSLSSLPPSLPPSINPLFPTSLTLRLPDVAVATIVFVENKVVSVVDAEEFAIGLFGEEGEEREEGEEGEDGVDEGRSLPEGE